MVPNLWNLVARLGEERGTGPCEQHAGTAQLLQVELHKDVYAHRHAARAS